MKVSCTKENLLEGLFIVSHVAGRNATLPILGNVLLRAERSGLTLVTTNLEVGMQTRVRGKVEDEGHLTIPAGLLTEYVNLLPNDIVILTTDETTLEITTKTRTSKVKGMSAEEFPVLPAIEHPHTIEVQSSQFKQAISQVAFAVATDDARPEISGVLLTLHEKECTLVATDSYRLSERKLTLAKPVGADVHVIIPARTLLELSRILADVGTLQVAVSENQIRFTVGETELISRLIEGHYPDYQQIIPERGTTTVSIDTDLLIQAVRSTSLFCKSGINDVQFHIDVAKQRLVVQATNTQIGESTSVVPVRTLEGDDLTIIFNYRYLLEGLQSISAPIVQLSFLDQNSPGVLRPEEGVPFLALIMPIKQ